MLQQLTPRYLEKVWGSEQLEPWFPKAKELAGTGKKIGEVWFEGPGELELPVLVKFLFTSQKLSVQVHPDDAYAARHHSVPGQPSSRGKTEMWHVLAAETGSRIAAGFREPISEARLRTSAESGEIEQLLNWHEAHPGDTFFIPAGTVHAIGGGLTLCEIQQRSDVTYRLYDYGRPRELHLDHSIAVSHRQPHSARVQARGEALVDCEYFTVGRREFAGKGEFAAPPGHFSLLIVIGGEGLLNDEPVQAGQVWYARQGTPPIMVSGPLTLLWVHTR